jgi:hypothetical protein
MHIIEGFDSYEPGASRPIDEHFGRARPLFYGGQRPQSIIRNTVALPKQVWWRRLLGLERPARKVIMGFAFSNGQWHQAEAACISPAGVDMLELEIAYLDGAPIDFDWPGSAWMADSPAKPAAPKPALEERAAYYPGIECEHGYDACPICDDQPKSRLVYMIRPIEGIIEGDSGRIDGRDGVGRPYFGLPIADDDGVWLEFQTFEAALEEAERRGMGPQNVHAEFIHVVWPKLDPSEGPAK